MPEWNGWAGTILNVDLTKGEVVREPLPREFAVKYIGGSGFGARILYDEVEPEVDPEGPDNIIILGQGPLSGTITPACGRFDMVMKSPVTGIFNRSNAGGFFGPELKWAGYDLIIIRGRSEKPVYLWIEDDDVELRDATHIWGRDTWITQQMIRDELGDPEIQTLKIGPAGENLCYLACVIGNLGRAAGRPATGTVWGLKKLKAIAVRGSKGVNIARPDELEKVCRKLCERVKQDPIYESFSHYGTLSSVSDPILRKAKGVRDTTGLFSTKFDKYIDKSLSCFGCDVHCSHYYTVKDGKYKGTVGSGPEGTAPLAAGLELGVNNPAFILKYNTLCNKLGLDASQAGMRVGWAMKLYEDGIITKQDTDGIELVWGDEDAVLKMLDKIVSKDGLGEIIDSPPLKAVAKLGRGSELYIGPVKGTSGQGVAANRDSFEHCLGLAVSTKGLDHLIGAPWITAPHTFTGMTDEVLSRLGKERYNDPKIFTEAWSTSPTKARYLYDHENICALNDMTGTCKFRSDHMLYGAGMHIEDMPKLLSAATGIDISLQDVVKAAEREMLIERAFNAREGIRRIDDYPYPFYWQLKHKENHPRFDYSTFPTDLKTYSKMLDEYYKVRGCDLETGIPLREKLEELGLKDVADDLEKRGILPTTK